MYYGQRGGRGHCGTKNGLSAYMEASAFVLRVCVSVHIHAWGKRVCHLGEDGVCGRGVPAGAHLQLSCHQSTDTRGQQWRTGGGQYGEQLLKRAQRRPKIHVYLRARVRTCT